jgi:hypothetical protein
MVSGSRPRSGEQEVAAAGGPHRRGLVLASAKEGEVIVLGADDVGHEIFLAQTFSHSSLKVVAGCDQCNSTT